MPELSSQLPGGVSNQVLGTNGTQFSGSASGAAPPRSRELEDAWGQQRVEGFLEGHPTQAQRPSWPSLKSSARISPDAAAPGAER